MGDGGSRPEEGGGVWAKQLRERENALLRNNKEPKTWERSQVLQRTPQGDGRPELQHRTRDRHNLAPGRTCPSQGQAAVCKASVSLPSETHSLFSANNRQRSNSWLRSSVSRAQTRMRESRESRQGTDGERSHQPKLPPQASVQACMLPPLQSQMLYASRDLGEP